MVIRLNKSKRFPITLMILALLSTGLFAFIPCQATDQDIISYTLNPKTQDLKLYWKDDKGQPFKSIQNLKTWVESKKQMLLFAMNAGMYKMDNSPLGLYIENSVIKSQLNTATGTGNFYLKPNGVFYISSDNKPFICKTEEFKNGSDIKYATQSGPMLVVDGQINPLFQNGSKNLNIRNGVGILPDGNVIFAISKAEINFYDFANYFKELGCKNALYLDGFVSRAYLPQQNWTQTDGNFGVIIGVTEKTTEK